MIKKIKLIRNIITKYWKIFIYIIIGLFFLNIYLDMKAKIEAGERREYNLKKQMILGWKKDSLAIVKKAVIIDSLEGVILSQMDIELTTDTIKLVTRGEGEGTDKTFNWENDCYKSLGLFETTPPYRLDQIVYRKKPLKIKVLITDLYPNIYGKVKLSDNCIKPNSVNFEVAPGLKGTCNPKGFGWKEFIFGGLIGTAITLYSTN